MTMSHDFLNEGLIKLSFIIYATYVERTQLTHICTDIKAPPRRR